MNKTLAILMLLLFANFAHPQQNNYKLLWREVEKLEVDGLPKSALALVEQIEEKANTDKNTSQQIKVLLFKSKFALTLEEEAQLKIMQSFKEEIATSEFPKKNILENILANLYWQYFQQNRYKFYNRTKTTEIVTPEDFRTWDLQTIFNEIHMHYQNSLKNGLLLQLEDLNTYNDILQLEEDSKSFRPTLYDLLAHNALDFYKTTENSITKPAYKFEIDDPDFLSDALTFSGKEITSKDTTSLQLHALNLYQDLIKFHLKHTSRYALVDVNIQRLLYVYEHATFINKNEVLIQALKNENAILENNQISGLYDFEIANINYQEGNSYQPKINEDVKWKLKDAYDLCESTIKKFPISKAAKKCKILQEQILQKSLQLTAESHLPIDQPSRLFIQYKNLDRLNFKIFKLSRNQYLTLNKTYRKEEQFKYINSLKLATQWQSKLRNDSDYQLHSTEVILPALSNGYFVVLASPEVNNEDTFAFAAIQVTDLAIVDKSDAKHQWYQLIDRSNGKPIENANVSLHYTLNNDNVQTHHSTSNSQGEIKITKSSDRYWRLNIEAHYKNDRAYFDNLYLNRYYGEEKEKVSYSAFLFSDRSIYRPGQTIFFKAIAIKKNKDGRSEVLPNEMFKILLYDVNRSKISELKLKSTDFGSVSGEFILPNSGLTGEYRIELDSESKKELHSYHHFSVEEYKRPKFEAKFNPITKNFRVNDSVTVTGNALAYAGSNITNAKVIYRVHRKVEYPRWYYWYRPWFVSEPQEIVHGEGLTNEQGEFEISFRALADDSVDKKNLPVFHYEVTADITDINGETRSASTMVNVGYHSLTATIDVAEKLDKTEKNLQINVETQNLNGEFVPSKGTIQIFKLEAPKHVLRKRPWNAPDYLEIPKIEFKKLFPHDAYLDEDDINNWNHGKLVFDQSFDTENSKEIALGNIKNWTSGQYLIRVDTYDQFGQLVKDEAKTKVFSADDTRSPDHQRFEVGLDKSDYKIGDTALLRLGSAGTITVTVDIEKDQKIIETHIVRLNDNIKTIKIPIVKDDLGGFVVHYSYAAYNSFESGSVHVKVPYPKTDLDIETLTFRDKLQPGEEETWSFKIKGPKGDKVAAEVLASMYDMSLDQFVMRQWNFNPLQPPIYYSNSNRHTGQSFGIKTFKLHQDFNDLRSFSSQTYDQLNWFGFYFHNYYYRSIRGKSSGIIADEEAEEVAFMKVSDNEETTVEAIQAPSEIELKDDSDLDKISFDNIQIRKNLQETAFFYPNLRTDENGHVTFSFTTPEAMTKWKVQLLAHTKSLESATTAFETVTQKELMVIPNVPRYLRESDEIRISSKIANISDNNLSGQAVLQLFDALTGKSIDDRLNNADNQRAFDVNTKGNTQVSWNLVIPNDIQAVQYKVIAKAGDFSDGEQNILPVLSNRMLVTETMPMWIRSNQTKNFTLDKLKNSTSSTLKHHKLTLEMTSNPAWYAVQALPYLMEYPYECNEQTFSRYYANALASHIANSNPRIQDVFKQWKNSDALLSNLEKNEELKSIFIQETPWLRDAQSETEQKKRIALLFDLNKMTKELQIALQKLRQNQMPSGAWSWFKGGRENRYITQHIISGFGHLKQLGVVTSKEDDVIRKGIQYLDTQFVKEYHDIRKYDKNVDLSKDHLSYTQLHYLYMRSFFKDIESSKEVQEITTYYKTQIQSYWLSRSLYAKGLMALIMHRMDDSRTSERILKSLKENSITSDELGMYWKDNSNSWHWYQAPIETQSLLIEAFSEIENNTETIDNLKIWLLKNKQTSQWKTTKATTEAVYALLLQGSDWLSVTEMVDVVLGGQQISPSKLEDVKVEAGTGYYKTSWNSSEIKPEMANVKITKTGDGIAWGSLYWQYFEDLDKITFAETPLTLKKKLFLKKNTDLGEQISEIKEGAVLEIGDLVRVRIELYNDRPMEFVHMKDMRASGLEPINVLSEYKWQDGLGYYESTKDAATNFFFDYLPKGVFVFEYDLRVNNSGNMSNGITTIQSMYAPEFSSHSEGIRLLVN